MPRKKTTAGRAIITTALTRVSMIVGGCKAIIRIHAGKFKRIPELQKNGEFKAVEFLRILPILVASHRRFTALRKLTSLK